MPLAYIKKNNLQDAKKRTQINADDALKAVFGGKKQVSTFEMTKLASKHVKESAFPNISPGSSGNGLPGFFLARLAGVTTGPGVESHKHNHED
jgi:hypothetical protein